MLKQIKSHWYYVFWGLATNLYYHNTNIEQNYER